MDPMPRTGLQTSSNYFSTGCPFNTPSAKALKGGFFFFSSKKTCVNGTADHRHFQDPKNNMKSQAQKC